jgi:drug/metabolite transporter (DMT)-like permease
MRSSAPSLRKVVPLLVMVTLLWGTNWALFPLAVQEVSVWTFRAACLLGSGSVVLMAARARGLSLHVPREERTSLVAAGLVYLVIWNVATAYAAILVPSGQAAILSFTMPVWATVFSWIFLGEKPPRRLLAGLALTCFGVGLLVFAGRENFGLAPTGFLWAIAAAIGWAIGTLILKRANLSVSPIVSTGWQLLVASVPITVAALFFGGGQLFMPSWKTVMVISYITVVPTAMGTLAWFSILRMLPASVSGISMVMVPIVAMLTGALFRHEPLGMMQIGAMLACASAMLLVLIQPRTR